MDSRSVGLAIIAAAVVLAVVGGAVALGLLSWFGRLPGDIRIESGNTRVYVPLVSMLLVSIVLSVALAIARRLF